MSRESRFSHKLGPALALASILAATPAKAQAPDASPQGWTQTEREIFWNRPAGSRIMPFTWFLKLEQADSAEPFAAHLAEYGALPSPAGPLPIGFSRERDRQGGTWLGLTCAACHVGAVTFRGKTQLIQGAGGMLDAQRLDEDLTAALVATAADDAKFGRFTAALDTLEPDRAALRERLTRLAAMRAAITAMNTPPHAYGPGRMDAVGIATNAIGATALGRPGNARTPDAPVRMPWLWTSPTYDRLQSTGIAPSAGLGPLLFGIVHALGAYATVDVATTAPYPSSVSIPDLDTIQALLRRLEPPPWPAGLLGPIDAAKAEQGAAVFANACASCHQVPARDTAGPIRLPLIGLEQIGTDPRAARNAVSGMVGTGVLEGRPAGVTGGASFGPRASAAAVAAHVGIGIALQIPARRAEAGLDAFRRAALAGPARQDAYKAIPLAGVWAGAPYLHNGSVANLRELLLPPDRRAVRFTVGGRDYDPAAIGFPADTAAPGFVVDTRLPGNANTGHAYGTTLPDADKAALLEFLKTL